MVFRGHLPEACREGRSLGWRNWRCERTGEVRSWTSGERHTGTDLATSEMGRPSSQGCPRWLQDAAGQITWGCRNPFPSLASRDGSQEGEIRARGEISLEVLQPKGHPGPFAAATAASSLASLATTPLHPPNTRSGPRRGRQANLAAVAAAVAAAAS